MSASKKRKESVVERQIYKEFKATMGHCEACGSCDNPTVHHLIGWSNHLWRVNLLNLVCLCRDCHDWAEKTEEGRVWIKQKYGSRIDALSKVKARSDDVSTLIELWRNRGAIGQ